MDIFSYYLFFLFSIFMFLFQISSYLLKIAKRKGTVKYLKAYIALLLAYIYFLFQKFVYKCCFSFLSQKKNINILNHSICYSFYDIWKWKKRVCCPPKRGKNERKKCESKSGNISICKISASYLYKIYDTVNFLKILC